MKIWEYSRNVSQSLMNLYDDYLNEVIDELDLSFRFFQSSTIGRFPGIKGLPLLAF